MEATQIRQQGWKAIDGSPYGLRWRQKGLVSSTLMVLLPLASFYGLPLSRFFTVYLTLTC